jgi:hypothetical protein
MNHESNYVDTLKSMKRFNNQKPHFTSKNAKILNETLQLNPDSNHIEILKSMKDSTHNTSFLKVAISKSFTEYHNKEIITV